MRTNLVFLAILVISFTFSSCEEKNEPELSVEKLVFKDLRVTQDNNLELKDVVDFVDTTSYHGYSFDRGHTEVMYNKKVLKSFSWVQYQSLSSFKSPIFWAKSNSVYVFTGNTSAMGLSDEIYIIDNGKFKVAPMIKNDTISAIVPSQIKDAYINFKERLISIKCDPNSGMATYSRGGKRITEATGFFKY